jgi:hypothetical protein
MSNIKKVGVVALPAISPLRKSKQSSFKEDLDKFNLQIQSAYYRLNRDVMRLTGHNTPIPPPALPGPQTVLLTTPRTDTTQASRTTDKYDLALLKLPQDIEEMLRESRKQHNHIPNAIYMNPATVKILTDAQVIDTGKNEKGEAMWYFRGCIKVIPKFHLSAYQFEIDPGDQETHCQKQAG